jgi:hypothetical protein
MNDKIFVDPNFVRLKWEEKEAALVTFEPDDFIYETEGKILYCDIKDNSGGEKEELIGKFRVYYVNLDLAASEAGCPAFEVFDTHSHGVSAYYRALFGSNTNPDEFSRSLRRLFDDELYHRNVLILDRLEILPKFRKCRLGLIVMRWLIQRFAADAGIVAIKPFPLQFEGKNNERLRKRGEWENSLELSKFCDDERKAFSKLRKYYRKLGFVPLRGSDFMFFATQYRIPSIEELLEKEG